MPPLTPSQRQALLRGFYGELELLDFVQDIYDDRKTHTSIEHLAVPESFDSVEDYIATFVPLFLEETKAQLHRAKEQELIASEQFRTDDFQILEESSGHSKWTLTRILPLLSGYNYHRGELVLISERPVSPENFSDPGRAHLLGVVDEVAHNTIAVSVRVSLTASADRSRAVAERIAAGHSWYVARLTSLATACREYLGLMRLSASPLVDAVVSGELADGVAKFPIPWRLEAALKRTYNQYQLDAIDAARKEVGVTLILGPPGTGKSHTILGVVATVLARLTQPELKSNLGRPVTIQQALEAMRSDDSSDAECSSKSSSKERKIQEMRKNLSYTKIGSYRPWEDKYRLKLQGGHKDSKAIYSTLTHSVVEVRKLHRCDKEEEDFTSETNGEGKVLVCAPSNAAIDELVRRMVRVGIVGKDGELYIPRVTRLGPNIHPELAEYSFGRQVEQRAARFGGEMRKIKNSILREAEIIAATLSVAGSADLADWTIDTIVVDEAGQGVELSTLIPLQLNCKRLILVGDHKQLPATVFSLQAQEKGYARSMFQRLISRNEEQAKMLKIQFRMHPEISLFPSQVFYDGELDDAPNIMQLVGTPEWYAHRDQKLQLGPVAFYDVADAVEESTSQSLVNRKEAEVVVKLVVSMMKLFPSHRWREKIAIISPYAEQVKLLRTMLKAVLKAGERSGCPIEVNTVDGFQGREKDVIIVSTVRARRAIFHEENGGELEGQVKNLHDVFAATSTAHKIVETKSIGFLRDARRMNVMFTRARQSLWVVGHWDTLLNDPLWADFLDYVSESRRVVVKPDTFVGLGRLEDFATVEAAEEAPEAAVTARPEEETEEADVEVVGEAEIADNEQQAVADDDE